MTPSCDDIREWLLLGRDLDQARAGHRAGCEVCQAEAAELAGLRATLAADVPEPPRQLAASVLRAAAPLLERNAERAWWRQSARALAAALVPLPLVVVANVLFVRLAYDWLVTVLPAGLGFLVVFNYVATLVLLTAAIYGAIPVLAARQAGFMREARHG